MTISAMGDSRTDLGQRTIAALYVDPLGPYPLLFDVDWYDEKRDARGYNGPHPVVAHPPCGPWGQLAHRCKRTQDKELGPLAVEAVRRFGGVLEHPAGSRLWKECGLPLPLDGVDSYGGFTLSVEQVAWGHSCRKPTWLYMVRVDANLARSTFRIGGEPTHQVFGSRQNTYKNRRTDLKGCSHQIRRRSPPNFAAWLVMLARSVT